LTRAAACALTIALVLPASLIAADDAAKELEKLEGTWSIVSAQEAGKEQTDEKSKKLSIVIEKDSFIWKYEGQPKTVQVTLKLDPTTKPKSVDLVSTLGKKRAAFGIYELNDDVLKICWARNGKARPDEFTTEAGDDRIFLTLQRVKLQDK
jgi:uncharacterized protein (TIGR03067 family)